MTNLGHEELREPATKINVSRITERKRKTKVPNEVQESSPRNGIMPILTF